MSALILVGLWFLLVLAVVSGIVLASLLLPKGKEYKTPPNNRIWGESPLPSRYPNKNIWG